MMSKEMLVSVIVPVYNAAKYVSECVQSLAGEETDGIEILLLDDCSTDNSEQICIDIANNNPKVKYYKLEHGGVSATRNAGIERATGKYVFFLDSDDRIEPGLIDNLVAKMEEHKAAMGNSFLREFGACSTTRFSLEGDQREVLENEETLNTFIKGKKSLMAIGGKMMLREAIGDNRFRTDLPAGEDTCFIYDFLLKGGRTIFEYDKFYCYRIHGGNTISSSAVDNFHSVITVNHYLYEKECERVGKKAALGIWLQQTDIIRTWMGRCIDYKKTRKLRKAIISNINAMKTNLLYTNVSKRFKVRAFAFKNMWPIYKLLFLGKSKPMPRCCGCSACADICPVGAIEMRSGKDGFLYPECDKAKCKNCGRCDEICPYNQDYDVKVENKYYSLQAKEGAVRKVSSSGGAFRLLAETILKRGGAVVGASMDELVVRHMIIESVDELSRIQGSKYVQSDTRGIFTEVKRLLDDGREVLFSGTPCQADALKRFLGRDYSNLFLIDLICNGVASPIIWKRYTRYLERKYKSKLISYSFRDKRNCDDGHTVAAMFECGEKTWSIYEDKFCLSYFRGISSREQCSNCLYSTDKRKSDVTIGDFWGIEKSHPEMCDGMGTSLLIVHTDKGNALLSSISKQVRLYEISEREARQPRLFYPAKQDCNARLSKLAINYMPMSLWFKLFIK